MKPIKKTKNQKKTKKQVKKSHRARKAKDISPVVHYELRPKNKIVTLRISKELLEAVKKQAKAQGIDYQKLIRRSLEKMV